MLDSDGRERLLEMLSSRDIDTFNLGMYMIDSYLEKNDDKELEEEISKVKLNNNLFN